MHKARLKATQERMNVCKGKQRAGSHMTQEARNGEEKAMGNKKMLSLICTQIHANLLSSFPINKTGMHQSNTDADYPALSGWGETLSQTHLMSEGTLNSGPSAVWTGDASLNYQCALFDSARPGLDYVLRGPSESLTEVPAKALFNGCALDLYTRSALEKGVSLVFHVILHAWMLCPHACMCMCGT